MEDKVMEVIEAVALHLDKEDLEEVENSMMIKKYVLLIYHSRWTIRN
jgi:hypothetical protein